MGKIFNGVLSLALIGWGIFHLIKKDYVFMVVDIFLGVVFLYLTLRSEDENKGAEDENKGAEDENKGAEDEKRGSATTEEEIQKL